jgi:hypothetical protein
MTIDAVMTTITRMEQLYGDMFVQYASHIATGPVSVGVKNNQKNEEF